MTGPPGVNLALISAGTIVQALGISLGSCIYSVVFTLFATAEFRRRHRYRRDILMFLPPRVFYSFPHCHFEFVNWGDRLVFHRCSFLIRTFSVFHFLCLESMGISRKWRMAIFGRNVSGFNAREIMSFESLVILRVGRIPLFNTHYLKLVFLIERYPFSAISCFRMGRNTI